MYSVKEILSNGIFKDNSIIGLSGLRKRTEYVKVTIPESYKKTYIPNYEQNFFLNLH